MTDYIWNEPPSEFMALLDAHSTLPFDSTPAPLDFLDLDTPPLDHQLVDDTPFVPPPPPSVLDIPKIEPVSEQGSEHDNSGIPPSPDSSQTVPTTNSLSSASDVTTGLTAVDLARKAAEDFANGKVSERKRRLGRHESDDAKRRKPNDSPVSDDDAPEKVSHRKYQKRLQKNRDSAYVSRIRRREYTKRLEDGLNRMEKEKLEMQTKYDALQRKFDVVLQELNTMKEATTAKFKALAGPVGGRAKTKGAGAIVTTMFMCALIFGFMVPESLTRTTPWRNDPNPLRVGDGRKIRLVGEAQRQKGRVWRGIQPVPPPKHWGLNCDAAVLGNIARNVSVLFGAENGGEMVRQLRARVQRGAVLRDTLDEMQEKSAVLVQNIHADVVRRTLPSRRGVFMKTVLKKLASVADECFTKELIALLTIRLLPTNAPGKLK